MEKEVGIIRNHKDTVFRTLFSNKSELLGLYNAYNHTSYTNVDDLQVVTLENAIYLGIKNDIGFVFNFQMNLYEHQSTWPLNICLRMLQYVTSELGPILNADETKYSSTTLIRIPEPRFVVFYNGIAMKEDEAILRLSDHFQRESKNPDLELKVHVLNINEGRNLEIVGACQTLLEYTQFIGKIRNNLKKHADRETAVRIAVAECIQVGILRDFLEKNRSEVLNMSLFEYDEDACFRVVRNEGIRIGLEEGRNQGLEEGAREERIRLLCSMVCKKLRRGKTVEEISDELEEDPVFIQTIVTAAEPYAPEYNEQKVQAVLLAKANDTAFEETTVLEAT